MTFAAAAVVLESWKDSWNLKRLTYCFEHLAPEKSYY